MKPYDVVALDEMRVDFSGNGESEQGNPIFEAHPDSASCNVLAMLSKLGRTCAFIGKVGDDIFGRRLLRAAGDAGIDMSALRMEGGVPMTLAFVRSVTHGERDFSFYRNPGAEGGLTEDELPMDLLRQARVFHFGTLSMLPDGARQATKTAVQTAKAAGAVISFDPNLRRPLWGSLKDAKAQMLWGLAQCDVAKLAEDELEFLTGTADYDIGTAKLRDRFSNLRLLCVTAGANGSYAYRRGMRLFAPSFLLGGTIETTGAGDAFCACVLDAILEKGLDGLTREDLKTMLRFANAAAYLATTKSGAMGSMPSRAQVEALLDKR